MNVREYGNKPKNTIDVTTKWTKFTLSKEMRYESAQSANWALGLLNKLRDEDFGRVFIPNYSVEQIDDVTLLMTTEYIKGRYVNREELIVIRQYVVDRINDPDNEYSFADYNQNNYITERDTSKIYNVDLDNYRMISIDDRWLNFKKVIGQHEKYQKDYGIEWKRSLNPENK
jgi:hypothetical protein